MDFIINDFILHYEKYGNGDENIVILPGFGDTRKTFDYMIDALKKYYTVYIIDFPGFGQSNFPNRDLTIYDYTNLIKDFLTTLNIDNPILIGHSFGGRVIITLTGYYNFKVKKVILIDSAGIKPKKKLFSRIKQIVYKLLKRLKCFIPKKHKKRYLNKLLALFASSDFLMIDEKMRNSFKNVINENLFPYLKNIDCETLLIWGEKDFDTPLSDGVKMNKEIKDSGLVVIEGTSHFCYLEKPYIINRIIINFISNNKINI